MTDIIDPIPTEQDIVAPEAEAEAEKQAEASWLDRSLVSLTTWNWEKAAWTALLIAALLIVFFMLRYPLGASRKG